MIYLKTPNGPLPINARAGALGNRAMLTIAADQYTINLVSPNAAEFATALRRWADILDAPSNRTQPHQLPAPRRQPLARDYDDLTPAAVIEYFEQSPVLQPIAADVRAALSGLITAQAGADASPQPTQLSEDLATIRTAGNLDLFDDEGHPTYGAQTRVAEALGISNEGGYRKRILAVLEALQPKSTTTNRLDASNQPAEQRMAA